MTLIFKNYFLLSILFSIVVSDGTTNLLEPKANYGVASYESTVFFAGGYDNYGVTDSVAVIDAKQLITGNTNDLIEARAFIAGTTVQHFAVFAGGITENGNTSDAIDIFDFNTVQSLHTTKTLSVSRTSIAAAAVGYLALFAGGWSDGIFYDTVDIFDTRTGNWTTASLSVPRSKIGATAVGNLAFFAGGLSSAGDSEIIDIFNYETSQWSTASLSLARHSIAAISFNLTAYFFGGSNSNRIDIYDVQKNSFRTTSMPRNTTYVVTAIGTSVYCLNDAEPSGTVDVYGYVTSSWQQLDYALPRYQLAPITVDIPYGQAALFAGGFLENGTVISVVSISTYCNFSTGYPYFGSNVTCPSPPSSIDLIIPKLKSTPWTNIYIACAGVGGVLIISAITISVVIYTLRKKREYSKLATEIPIKKIKDVEILHLLGSGQFGEVYKGTWMKTTTVAVKKLKNKDYLQEFEHEVAILCNLNHPNCVRLYGIYEEDGQQMMVFEYLSDGNLSTLLQTSTTINSTTIDLIKMAQHIVNGMLYLEENHIVHRDLALRNVLVTSVNGKYVAKVSDFGMSRTVDTEYYRTQDRTIAVKWAAIESIAYGKFSSKSDVWSFGICLWELFSFGKIPYPGMSNATVIKQVEAGYRLPPPDKCPEEIYKVMFDCWETEPKSRPSFSEISKRLDEIALKYNDSPTIMAECNYVLDVSNDSSYLYN